MQNINVTDPATGRTAVAQIDDTENKRAEELRSQRIKDYTKFWLYYEGKQYDKDNFRFSQALGIKSDCRLPEHERLHSYSGVIEEGIDFITDQLVENLNIEVKSDAEIKSGQPDDKSTVEQQIYLNIWEQSDMELNAPDLTREALVSAESYILLRWDEAEKIVRIIPYDAENVDPVYSRIIINR